MNPLNLIRLEPAEETGVFTTFSIFLPVYMHSMSRLCQHIMIYRVLTIAGSDSGGGAGIQADLKTFSALGVYGCSVITAVTAQNTQSVTDIHLIPNTTIQAQIEAVLDDILIDAIKIGMLGSSSIVKTVAKTLQGYSGPIVLDPVIVAKSGATLLDDHAIDALRDNLLPRANLLTPNIPEANTLLGHANGNMFDRATGLMALGPKAILMKGGHGKEAICSDFLVDIKTRLKLETPRINTCNTHGTGCSYSSAIAAGLAKGWTLTQAVETSHHWLHQAIRQSDKLSVGKGFGPIHHFHNIWTERWDDSHVTF